MSPTIELPEPIFDVVEAYPELADLRSSANAGNWDRITKRAKDVTDEQWRVFRNYLNEAEQILIEVTAREPKNALAWRKRQDISLGISLGVSESRRRYAQANKALPHFFPAQSALAYQLTPKWGGNATDMHAFAKACADEAPLGAVNAVIVAEAHVEHAFDDFANRDEYMRQPDFQSGYGWVKAHSTFALAFSMAGKHARAAEHFHALGDLAADYDWYYYSDKAGTYKEGPTTAGLAFRVGTADETLPQSGITHLVEHLALFDLGVSDYHYNSATSETSTQFYTHGSDDDVVSFLQQVCAGLTNMPMHRLDIEKEILHTESASRNSAATDQLRLWRYGPRSYGIGSYDELGLPRLTADVQAWTTRYFTKENAALWIVGEKIPDGLTLALPTGGQRHPVPAASSALPTTPAYFSSGKGKVVMDAVIPRSTAALLFTHVLSRRLFQDLRQEGGYSYTATASYAARGDDHATITALADALPDKQDAVLGGFLDILTQLRLGLITQEELDTARKAFADQLGDANYDVSRLPNYCVNVLTGQPTSTLDELHAESAAVTLEDVRKVSLLAWNATLLNVNNGQRADWAGLVEAPTHSTTAVAGTMYRPLDDSRSPLIIGNDGITEPPSHSPTTITYANCEALLAWPDGARRLIGTDGLVIHVEPTLYQIPPAVLAGIDTQIGPDRTIPMPARRNDQIPHPEKPKPAADVPTAPWAAASKEQAKKTGMSWKQRTFLTVIAAIAALQWVVALNDMASDDGSDTSAATGLRHLFTAIIVTVVVIRQYLRWRKRK